MCKWLRKSGSTNGESLRDRLSDPEFAHLDDHLKGAWEELSIEAMNLAFDVRGHCTGTEAKTNHCQCLFNFVCALCVCVVFLDNF